MLRFDSCLYFPAYRMKCIIRCYGGGGLPWPTFRCPNLPAQTKCVCDHLMSTLVSPSSSKQSTTNYLLRGLLERVHRGTQVEPATRRTSLPPYYTHTHHTHTALNTLTFTEQRRTPNQNLGTAFPKFQKMDDIENFVFIMHGKYTGLGQILYYSIRYYSTILYYTVLYL